MKPLELFSYTLSSSWLHPSLAQPRKRVCRMQMRSTYFNESKCAVPVCRSVEYSENLLCSNSHCSQFLFCSGKISHFYSCAITPRVQYVRKRIPVLLVLGRLYIIHKYTVGRSEFVKLVSTRSFGNACRVTIIFHFSRRTISTLTSRNKRTRQIFRGNSD